MILSKENNEKTSIDASLSFSIEVLFDLQITASSKENILVLKTFAVVLSK